MSAITALEMKARLRDDLLCALKARRMDEAKVLRALLAALDNAEAPPMEHRSASLSPPAPAGSTETDRLVLDPETIARVIAADIAERETAASQMEALGSTDRAEALRAEARIASRYLPEG